MGGGKMCRKGKSCGATCINRNMRCVLELGPVIAESVGKVRDKIGVMQLWRQAKEQKAPGYNKKFNEIKKQVEQERAGGFALRRQADLKDFEKKLKDAGILQKSAKSEDAGAIFAKAFQQQKPKSVPPDLKAQLAALGGAPAPMAPRQLERSPGDRTKTPPAALKKGQTDLIFDDISRIMRGESPRNLQIASAGDELGIKARVKPTEVRNIERDLRKILGSRAKESMNLDQLREAAAKEANDLSALARKKVSGGDERIALRGRVNRLESVINRADNLNATATGNTRWARVDAKDFDDALSNIRREGSKTYKGWEDSHGSGARKIGEGAYGTVMRNPDGTFVKRGAISDTEAALIRRLGDADLGPKLKAADINGPHEYNKERFVDIRNGRIAMSEVAGKPITAAANADTKFGGKNAADAYWKALADLHRMGIAHNDAHIDNILVDNKGKGRWVDLGLAQASPKAALAEAMGVFPTLRGTNPDRIMGAAGQGNWQTRKWDGTGARNAERAKEAGGRTWAEFQQRFPVASRVWENKDAAQNKLAAMGLSNNEISSIIDHGIRSPMETYTKGPWAKLSDAQAQDVLNTLYDGI